MKNLVITGIALTMIIGLSGAVIWMNQIGKSNPLKHDTDRWAVIEDINRDRIAVETVSDEVWSQLTQLNQNETRMWIGGIVSDYDNKWGFRFDPETITVAEVTAEGLQATIRYISENLDYWLGEWAYVNAKVIEIHSGP
ncbi:hypothetical protein DRO69_06755 [Candidatus Bathyarchaeota archaeon]|nr:MAG: hypothetical protein DRO69_06755 [Candidatus Bathyarchaeota archaeon]